MVHVAGAELLSERRQPPFQPLPLAPIPVRGFVFKAFRLLCYLTLSLREIKKRTEVSGLVFRVWVLGAMDRPFKPSHTSFEPVHL